MENGEEFFNQGEIIQGIKALKYDFHQYFNGLVFIHRRMLDLIRQSDSQKILDVGCGTGTMLFKIWEQGRSIELWGIDPSEDMIEVSKKKNKVFSANINFKVGFGERLDFKDNEFDLVISSMAFHHMSRKTKVLVAREIFRVLRPSGRLLVTDWGKPRNLVGRIMSTTVKDHVFSEDNLKGVIREILEETGFKDVVTYLVQFGYVEHLGATKP